MDKKNILEENKNEVYIKSKKEKELEADISSSFKTDKDLKASLESS